MPMSPAPTCIPSPPSRWNRSMFWMFIILCAALAALLALLLLLRSRHAERWIVAYLRQAGRRQAPLGQGETHLLLCIADHFEPHNGDVSDAIARQRVEQWVEAYPRLFSQFNDSDNRNPRHTFNYPKEQYDPAELGA